MKNWKEFLLERDEPRRLPGGRIDFPSRNSYAAQGPIHGFDKNTKDVYQDIKTGKIYQLITPPTMDGGEWWVSANELDPHDAKILRKENHPLEDLLPNLKTWNSIT
jgi:hypothetical protein